MTPKKTDEEIIEKIREDMKCQFNDKTIYAIKEALQKSREENHSPKTEEGCVDVKTPIAPNSLFTPSDTNYTEPEENSKFSTTKSLIAPSGSEHTPQKKGMGDMCMSIEKYVDYQEGFDNGYQTALKDALEVVDEYFDETEKEAIKNKAGTRFLCEFQEFREELKNRIIQKSQDVSDVSGGKTK